MALETNVYDDELLEAELLSEIVEVTKYETYDGEYTVIPTLENQTLATADKLMKQDVTIEKIPHYEVSNNAGGTTFIIAEIN